MTVRVSVGEEGRAIVAKLAAELGVDVEWDRVARIELTPRELVVEVLAKDEAGLFMVGPAGAVLRAHLRVKVSTR